MRNLTNKFKSEAGCPVDLVSAKTELEIDSFGAPNACRIYIDYKNVAAKPISAVKFRMGYVDEQEIVRRFFKGDDEHQIAPGDKAHKQWRVGADPRTAYVAIRAIAVKFSDGSEWRSEKFKDPAAPGTANTSGSAAGSDAEVGGPDPAVSVPSSGQSQSDSASNNSSESSSSASSGSGEVARSQAASGSSPATSPESDKSNGGY